MFGDDAGDDHVTVGEVSRADVNINQAEVEGLWRMTVSSPSLDCHRRGEATMFLRVHENQHVALVGSRLQLQVAGFFGNLLQRAP